jgi:hypothetical protein
MCENTQTLIVERKERQISVGQNDLALLQLIKCPGNIFPHSVMDSLRVTKASFVEDRIHIMYTKV